MAKVELKDEIVIDVRNLTKVYKIFERPTDRMKEALHPFHKRYSRDFHALTDVSFEVHRGETIGIIGRNGAGKSTLLKMITGVLTPSGGTMRIQGRISSLLELGAGFNPDMTGRENVYMNGTIMGYSREEMDERLSDILAFADIGEFIEQPVKMYSSGMFARLAFAVAIHVEPDILIVDEALSVGDVFFQNKCFRKFEELKRHGVTILFVSHDLGSVRQMTSRVLWLEHGKQQMFGPTEEVCDAYFREQLRQRNTLVSSDVAEPGLMAASAQAEPAELRQAAAGEVVEFPRLERCAGEQVASELVKIQSFFLEDGAGRRVQCMEPDQSYDAVFAVEFSAPVHNVIFGFVMENAKGIQVLSLNSFINNEERPVEVEHPCVMCVRFSFQLPRLQKGDYVLSPAVAQGVQGEHVMLTWLQGVSRVTVANAGYNLSIVEIPAKVMLSAYDAQQVRYRD